MLRVLQKLWIALTLFFGSLLIGIIGFMLIEGFSLNEAFYMAVITFSTVGFQEIHPLSSDGRFFTGVYIIVNLGIFAYVISVFTTYLFEGELRKAFHNFLIGREVKKMKNHIIICGFGRNGAKTAEVLYAEGKKFVVVENDQETINSQAINRKYQFVQGDATQDEVLLSAGIQKANTIITALPRDTDNVFITLTAKQLNGNIMVISRASEVLSEKKLFLAGADHVIMPDTLGGIHMAQLITKPFVIELLDMLNGIAAGNESVLEEISFSDLKDEMKDKSLKELDIRNTTGVSIIAYKNGVENFKFNPGPDKVVGQKDVLILLGKQKDVDKFRDTYCA